MSLDNDVSRRFFRLPPQKFTKGTGTDVGGKNQYKDIAGVCAEAINKLQAEADKLPEGPEKRVLQDQIKALTNAPNEYVTLSSEERRKIKAAVNEIKNSSSEDILNRAREALSSRARDTSGYVGPPRAHCDCWHRHSWCHMGPLWGAMAVQQMQLAILISMQMSFWMRGVISGFAKETA